jgi:NADH-quinone oxidoreductase subunit N
MSLEPKAIFANAVVIDKFSTLMKIVMVIGTMATAYLSYLSKDIYKGLKSEFLIMSVGVLIGGMLLASANNLLTVYLGIETLSILSYVMSSFKRHESISTEAGIKYALYGGISAGVMLFGMSHIYGLLGTIQFNDMIPVMADMEGFELYTLLIAFVFYFAGIGYKIACFPFHMWSPDVYQGSPIPVTTFFAIVPKFAGIAVLVRTTFTFFGVEGGEMQIGWVGLIQVIAALTMTVGNVSAIGQDSVKRLLAFSSIGHVGMILLGLVTISANSTKIILFYSITYMFMTLIAFYVTSSVSDKYGTDSHSVFKGLIKNNPFMAIVMSLTLFSLAGMPPLSGFVAKFNMLSAIIESKYYALAFIAAINSVISLYYYVRLVKIMIIDAPESENTISNLGITGNILLGIYAVPVFLLGIFWEKVMLISEGAKIYIFQ